MAANEELLANALVNREFVYRFLWRFFAKEPDAEMLALCGNDLTAQQMAVFFEEGSTGLNAFLALAQLAGEYAAGQNGGIDRLSQEFTRLFLGPAAPVAPLWESVYADNDHLLFTQTTLDVRETYRTAGYVASAYPKEADDHLAIELDFLAALTGRCAQAVRANDTALARAYLVYQRAFLEHHVGRLAAFASERLAQDIPEGFGNFYPYALALTREACTIDMMIVEQLQALLGEDA